MIYLDMDGVIANFNQALLDVMPDCKMTCDQLDQWDVWKCLGLPSNQALWDILNPHGSQWWSRLKKYPWTDSLITGLKEIGPVCILTNPSWSSDAAKGKMEWLQRYFGYEFEDYIFTKHKHLLAKQGDILIDDSPGNCQKFKVAGGMSILFPQTWNANEAEGLFRPERAENVVTHTKYMLA